MSELLSSSPFWMCLSIVFYALGVKIQQKTGSPLCNPLLIASILVGAVLVGTGTPYHTYEQSGELISFSSRLPLSRSQSPSSASWTYCAPTCCPFWPGHWSGRWSRSSA